MHKFGPVDQHILLVVESEHLRTNNVGATAKRENILHEGLFLALDRDNVANLDARIILGVRELALDRSTTLYIWWLVSSTTKA